MPATADHHPPRAAALLREIAPGSAATQRQPAWLRLSGEHVLGEKLGAWGEAHGRFEPLLGGGRQRAPPVLCRQAATAAHLARDTSVC